ncbi:MAG: nitronate monooxygenase, partial [Alicyclobacillus sp.]|nr:nitronate monooxygenase [Alicyclobacillus sp.]
MIRTALTDALQIQYPIVQAGMAGGITTPNLVAAVSGAGALGTIGAGYLTPDEVRHAIRQVRALTDRPFAVNLFVPSEADGNEDDVARMNEFLNSVRSRLGLAPCPPSGSPSPRFADQVEVLLDERVPVFSFTFGIPPREVISEFRRRGTVVVGTATTVQEAVELEAAGVDAVVAQGSEAGG